MLFIKISFYPFLFQRVLSSKTALRAQMLSYGGAAIALIMTGPSVLFGAIGKVSFKIKFVLF